MLQLLNLRKSYTTGAFTQRALDDVSISFRDNEFVAILGPSGSGKTTMLNIIGGLDHYDSGDVIIDGISTKKYKDRDWDTYRNNRIGFVFQSYNLITHQSVLANVELALTLSGVSRGERRRRAMAALDDVGLAEHAHKKPSQLSGGQMQRVAIARALINDPEILLADEPTGALDSKTSVHVMDLLTQIARDRLVVMVTHNPELAKQYATRTVALRDGVIVQDTDPYLPLEEAEESKKRAKRTSMSFLTAIALSFTNLMTKKGRTLMTAFAGSIGIVGIAAILALANGVNAYIKDIEEETLSMYPLTIQAQGMDMTAMLAASTGGDDGSAPPADPDEDVVREYPLLTGMFSGVNTNDLTALKEFLDDNGGGIDQYVNSIEYSYDVTPQVYSPDISDGVRQVNPDSTFSALGLAGESDMGGPFAAQMQTNAFMPLMDDLTLVESQYDVVAGGWPSSHDEVVVVLSERGGLSDFVLFGLGLRDRAELDEMVEQLRNGEEIDELAPAGTFTYDEVMDVTFTLVHATDYYTYDEDFEVWTDRRSDNTHMRGLVADGEELRVAGILKPKPDASVAALQPAIYYPPALTTHIIEQAAETRIVQDQLAARDVNVFTGRSFSDDEPDMEEFDLGSLITIDEDAIAEAFTLDESMLTIDTSALDISMPEISLDPGLMPELDLSSVVDDIDLGEVISVPDTSGTEPVDPDDVTAAATGLLEDYGTFVAMNQLDPTDVETNLTLFTGSPEGQEALESAEGALDADAEPLLEFMAGYLGFSVANELNPEELETNLVLFLTTDEGQAALTAVVDELTEETPGSDLTEGYVRFALTNGLDPTDVATTFPAFLTSAEGQAALEDSGFSLNLDVVEQQIQTAMADYMQQVMAVYMDQVGSQIATALETQIGAAMESMMGQFAETMSEAMGIDEEAFADAFQFNLDQEELTQLLMAMTMADQNTYDRNLRVLGYADFDSPSRIDLYPVDFESKGEVTEILNAYNDQKRDEGNEEQVITYTDIVGALMSSVTDIVNMISYVLVAFVAISLVVSSIMIGVITYISVLERRKEIGILRAVGASKGDVGRVFNAETLIVGFVAGAMGIGITFLLTIPANAIVLAQFDVANVARLPWAAAGILVLISMGLTFLAGLIPSSAASRKDPVEALRSE